MAKLTDAELAEALRHVFNSGSPFHQLAGHRWRFKGEATGAAIAFVVANQSKDYPNCILNDRDWDAIDEVERNDKYDHCCLVLAKMSANGTLTYHSHITVAEARARIENVRHDDGAYRGYRLLPPDFAEASFATADDKF
jgi:hypothetical protein